MRKKILVIIVILLLVVFGKVAITTLKLSPFLFQLLFSRDISLKKVDNRVNIILLGIAGGTHEGPNLTDTIIFTSIDPKTDKLTLVSIPRDLWIPDIAAKINTAYAIGESKRKGGGLILTRAIVSKILNQPIDYSACVNFAGFVKAVNLIGGLDIAVERAFDDYEYPIEGKETDTCGHSDEETNNLATASSQLEAFPCRYMHLHFDQGTQHLDGETALKFVRSRHAIGEEGSDFARSKRQEKAIAAFKNKVLSFQTLLNPVKIIGLYSAVSENIDTDIEQSEFDDFIRLAQEMKKAKIQSAVFDYGNKEENRPGLLINPLVSSDYDNQWVLIPRIGNGNFSEIQKYVECEIKTGNCSIPKNQ